MLRWVRAPDFPFNGHIAWMIYASAARGIACVIHANVLSLSTCVRSAGLLRRFTTFPLLKRLALSKLVPSLSLAVLEDAMVRGVGCSVTWVSLFHMDGNCAIHTIWE